MRKISKKEWHGPWNESPKIFLVTNKRKDLEPLFVLLMSVDHPLVGQKGLPGTNKELLSLQSKGNKETAPTVNKASEENELFTILCNEL